MNEDRHDKLLSEDWSDAWEELPEAPALVPRPKTAQITLRLSPSLVERIRRVGELRSLPYHSLARSWLVDAIQRDDPPAAEDAGPHTAQLNLKLEEQAVDALKNRADKLRCPYHRLARDWIAAAVAGEEQRLAAEPQAAAPPSRDAASPYSTGGGGVTFERRVAALYLALLLTGDSAAELGGDREVRSVAFQQAPRVPVDDLVILAARPDEPEPSMELALAARRSPNIVKSDGDTQALVVEFLRAAMMAPADGPERRLALAVAGAQPHAAELERLATLARTQAHASGFFDLLGTPKKFEAQLRSRLNHVETLVRNALPELGVPDADEDAVRRHTWEFVRRLFVLMPRVEEPDTRDWDATRRDLRHVARGGRVVVAGHLRDRLETLAAQYAPSAATVDRTMLSRQVHSLLDDVRERTRGPWEILDSLQQHARSAVRDQVGGDTAGGQLHLDRSSEAAAVIAAAQSADVLLITGESGVGKSALVLGAISAAEAAANGEVQAVWLNLRDLPETPFELTTRLGCPIERVLSDLTAPARHLVIDAADAAAELRGPVFTALAAAARISGVRLIAIASIETSEVIKDLLASQQDRRHVGEHQVPELTDGELHELTDRFPKLARLAADRRSRGLLRRLVVVDLLVRSGVTGLPLADADAMREIWEGLVRNRERRDRQLPDSREQTMLRLAVAELHNEPVLQTAAALDPAAVDALRQDGLLRRPTDNPWRTIPEFAHDELRRYAVARALLADDNPSAALLAAGAPRWTLSAGRLACQAMLDQPDRPGLPVRGRFTALQRSFDQLVDAGHGARWADLPSEALLTLADPAPILADAWPDLRADDGAGLQRLLRLVGQRHRDSSGIVDPDIIEPVIARLSDEPSPWERSDEAAGALRDWLLALAIRDTEAGHPLRASLCEKLVAACAAADEQLAAEEQAHAAALAARTPDEIERHRKIAERHRLVIEAGGLGRRRRRDRPTLPRTLTDKTVLGLVALLGPDLGQDGEQLLRRVARDAPERLAPAVDEAGAGRALAGYGGGLLADLAEAYYLDEDADDSRIHDRYGIRDHRARGFGGPLSAWYRGPFMMLFQTDFRRGVTVLNRLLNHAARARARTMAGMGDPWERASEEAVAAFRAELSIAGKPRQYFGDDHVWRWYRGTGVGPYPCMSALQALERYCDMLLAAELPPDWLISILLDGCENLAMPGLVVGILVRHIEKAGTLLDPFLAEPVAWHLEFIRTVDESGSLAASSEGLAAPERRTWSLREAATWLTVTADPERAEELRAIGDRLVTRAAEIDKAAGVDPETAAGHGEGTFAEVSLITTARNWASGLDRSRYQAVTEGDLTYVQSTPPEDVEAALEPGNRVLRRGQEVLRLFNRYFLGALRRSAAEPPADAELAADVASAGELLDEPPERSAIDVWDMAGAVAAHALKAQLIRGVGLPAEAEQWSASTVVAAAENVKPRDPFEFEETSFDQGADRSAARALPLLLLPAAGPLREAIGGEARVMAAGSVLARAVANETRLYLARGLDPVWDTPCDGEAPCHHQLALQLAVESMRDAAFGDWDDSGHRRSETLDDPVTETLAAFPADRIFFSRLDAAIRAAGAAAIAHTCVRDQARGLLLVLVEAQRRALLAYEENFDERGSHALVAARALLALAGAGDDGPLREHIAAYADNSTLLGSFLSALAAAGEEHRAAGAAARQVWPTVMVDVLELNRSGHEPFGDGYYGSTALASLIPAPTYENAFLYWEVDEQPVVWADPLAWEAEIDAWLPVAAGDPHCVDAMIGLLRTLAKADQARFGLSLIAALVHGDPAAMARRSWLLTGWLKDIRAAAVDESALTKWQEIVDALVVAGNTSLAPYSD